jgi:hypothetical protein
VKGPNREKRAMTRCRILRDCLFGGGILA